MLNISEHINYFLYITNTFYELGDDSNFPRTIISDLTYIDLSLYKDTNVYQRKVMNNTICIARISPLGAVLKEQFKDYIESHLYRLKHVITYHNLNIYDAFRISNSSTPNQTFIVNVRLPTEEPCMIYPSTVSNITKNICVYNVRACTTLETLVKNGIYEVPKCKMSYAYLPRNREPGNYRNTLLNGFDIIRYPVDMNTYCEKYCKGMNCPSCKIAHLEVMCPICMNPSGAIGDVYIITSDKHKKNFYFTFSRERASQCNLNKLEHYVYKKGENIYHIDYRDNVAF
jgi:hypothetical protein